MEREFPSVSASPARRDKPMTEPVGYCIYKGDTFLIREKVQPDKTQLFIHRVVNGNELIPRGYMAGANYLEISHEIKD